MSRPRLAVVCDLLEENWPSMDLFGEMLVENLQSHYQQVVQAALLRPPMVRSFGRLSFLGASKLLHNADRLWNRYVQYPHFLRGQWQDDRSKLQKLNCRITRKSKNILGTYRQDYIHENILQ